MNECFFCGSRRNLERHHVYGGALRKKSEKYGYVVYLCHSCHNEPPYGVHFNAERMLTIKRRFQRIAMRENGWSIADFVREFYKNYLEEWK